LADRRELEAVNQSCPPLGDQGRPIARNARIGTTGRDQIPTWRQRVDVVSASNVFWGLIHKICRKLR